MTVHPGGSSGGMPRKACVAPRMSTRMSTRGLASSAADAAHPTAPAHAPAAVAIASFLAIAALALVIDTWPRGGVDRLTAALPPAPRRVMVPVHRIDIDRADLAELSLLPEIGPALAARIAADRAVHGAFGSIDALARVEGIGPARILALRAVATASGLAGVPGEGAEDRR